MADAPSSDSGAGTRWIDQVQLPDENNRDRWREAQIAWRAARILRDNPGQTQYVFDLVENFPARDFLRWHTRRLPFLRHPRLQQLWAERSMPDLRTEAVLPMEETLAPGTLGHEYARFVRARGLDNLFLRYLQIDGPDKWFVYRMGHLHDLFHFLLGYDPYDPIGEMEVECFLHAQSGAANHVLFLAGYVRFLLRNEPSMLLRGLPRLRAAYRLGRRVEPLLLVKWEEQLARPLEEVRAELGIAERPVCLPTSRRPPRVTPRIAHVVYNVPDLERAVGFYTTVFGYQRAAEDRALGVTFLTAGDDHHTIALQECLSLNPLHWPRGIVRGLRRLVTLFRAHRQGARSQSGRRRVLPPPRIVLASLRTGMNHIGFRVDSEADLKAYYERMRARAVPIEWAVNHGDMIKGIYFRDPAGNLCELFVDGERARSLRARLDAGLPIDDVETEDFPTWELNPEEL